MKEEETKKMKDEKFKRLMNKFEAPKIHPGSPRDHKPGLGGPDNAGMRRGLSKRWKREWDGNFFLTSP